MEPSKLDHHLRQQAQLRGSAIAAAPASPLVGSYRAWSSNHILLIRRPKYGLGSFLPHPSNMSLVPEIGLQRSSISDTCDHEAQLGGVTEEPSYPFLKLTSCGAVWNPGGDNSARGRLNDFSATPDESRCGSGSDLVGSSPSSSNSFVSSLAMQELHAMEALASSGFDQTFLQPSLSNMVFSGEGGPHNLGDIQLPFHQWTSNECPKLTPPPPFCFCFRQRCRLSSAEAQTQMALKPSRRPKMQPPRLQPRPSSSPHLKVRKEKLSDRVAALQQLVAPFGKTDTASVLTEAVGYIKFLQEQVQTLSMPYLRSSRKRTNRHSPGQVSNEEEEDIKRDLTSRGLCLVPLAYTSYFTSESASAWSPSRFGGT
ncbi:unnamed protein product [Spirodela intermedia]|uniref:BHLH domain-containing protein n=1 Tax=Spirodela intermedia TaxID=51605 RepID=A0A7I8J5S8_SPIIN|nr:unnamed protein product [Spirodela intermedia]CAA6665586.1 unnamed protein product [Spirodela intermedia]